MEQEPGHFPEGEEPIDPKKAAITDAEMAANATTGSAETAPSLKLTHL